MRKSFWKSKKTKQKQKKPTPRTVQCVQTLSAKGVHSCSIKRSFLSSTYLSSLKSISAQCSQFHLMSHRKNTNLTYYSAYVN